MIVAVASFSLHVLRAVLSVIMLSSFTFGIRHLPLSETYTISFGGFVGQWAITVAFKRGEASFIAAFEYTALVWGALLGWFVWHTLPGPSTWLGAAIVIASGLYIVRSERRKNSALRHGVLVE